MMSPILSAYPLS